MKASYLLFDIQDLWILIFYLLLLPYICANSTKEKIRQTTIVMFKVDLKTCKNCKGFVKRLSSTFILTVHRLQQNNPTSRNKKVEHSAFN